MLDFGPETLRINVGFGKPLFNQRVLKVSSLTWQNGPLILLHWPSSSQALVPFPVFPKVGLGGWVGKFFQLPVLTPFLFFLSGKFLKGLPGVNSGVFTLF